MTGTPKASSLGIAREDTPVSDLQARIYAGLGRMRFQLIGGVISAVILPAIVRTRFENYPDVVVHYDNSMWGTLFALLLGFLVFRKVTAYPGVQSTAYILPAFIASYMLTVTIFFMLRLEYSRAQFLVSFVLTTGFFYLVSFLMRRGRRLDLTLVPVGDVSRLSRIKEANVRLLASPEEAASAGAVVVDLKADLPPEWERFIADSVLEGRRVYNAKEVIESLTGRVQIEHISENRFGTLNPDSIYESAKRYVDFALALTVLILLSPLFLMVGLAIRLDSPGPAIFRQERVGFRGRAFWVYKFRTMRHDEGPADRVSQMTLPNDARITRLGRFLRKSRIDELPQIVNILRMEMSWIGPRPEALGLSSWYEGMIPFYRYRHVVRPGITGWAQVNQGHVTSVDDADLKLQYDFYYVKNFSMWLDILVLLKTVRIVLTGHGAK
jgi:lipopolysaccharide/colanic/teichoic acid biosynthesis glycosyltransferase